VIALGRLLSRDYIKQEAKKMKHKATVLVILFALFMLTAQFAAGAERRFQSREVALETIMAEVKRELGGVPLTGFIVTAEDLDLYGREQRLSYSGEFRKPGTMSKAALEQARRHFVGVVARGSGIESYDIELDDDSLDITFEQSRNIVILSDSVYAAPEYVPYVSVSISLTAEDADDVENSSRAGYTTQEYNIDVTLERNVVRLQVGQKDARVNGEARRLEVAPFVKDGRTLVPFRFLGEQLGATLSWDEDDKEVTFTSGAITIKLRLGDDDARIHIKGAAPKTVALDTPARVVEGRTVVPLRFVSENLDAAVRWNPRDRSIIVRQ
ncbi:MAG: copper amine oxidase N-terminal domain-containing protein, partial [Firmicutes bacterium]|nr:copper amine oxidase N-terminal domain-containing protein [Bacillota bacterium]